MTTQEISTFRFDSKTVENAWKRIHNEWPNHKDVATMEIMESYNKWELYDEDMVVLGYQGANILVEAMMTLNLPKDISILDVACGTGLAGVQLDAAGYRNIDGHDGSRLLLGYAKEKNVYKHIYCFLIQDNIDLPIGDSTYDVVLAAGTLCPGHITPSAFINLFRLIKPGGYFGHTTRSAHLEHDNLYEFQDLIAYLISQGKIEKVMDDTFRSMYENVSTNTKLEGTVQIYRKLF